MNNLHGGDVSNANGVDYWTCMVDQWGQTRISLEMAVEVNTERGKYIQKWKYDVVAWKK